MLFSDHTLSRQFSLELRRVLNVKHNKPQRLRRDPHWNAAGKRDWQHLSRVQALIIWLSGIVWTVEYR